MELGVGNKKGNNTWSMCQVFYIDFRSFHAIILQRFREIAEHIARSSNGRTEAFGAFNLGSIPSLAAKSQYQSFLSFLKLTQISFTLMTKGPFIYVYIFPRNIFSKIECI